METHGENLERVSVRMAPAVIGFFRVVLCRQNHLFHADELRNHVTDTTGINAPASADRVMRDLRNPRRQLNYKVISRRESLYEAIWVRPRPGESTEGAPVEPKDGGPIMPSEVMNIQSALVECEARIEQHFKTAKQSYREIGRELRHIRSQRLYEATHKNFEEYCRERWGFSRVHAHRQIEAAGVAEDAALPIGNTPENEWQARCLAALPPELRQEVWDEAVRDSPNGRVTGKAIREKAQARVAKRGRPPGTKKIKEPESEYVRWFFQEFMRRRKEADLANSKRSWNPDAICKVDLINIMLWVETELQTYIGGDRSVNRREKVQKLSRQGHGATYDYKDAGRNGPADAGIGTAV